MGTSLAGMVVAWHNPKGPPCSLVMQILSCQKKYYMAYMTTIFYSSLFGAFEDSLPGVFMLGIAPSLTSHIAIIQDL